MTINLNDRIKVKLTEFGKAIYINQIKELNDRFGRQIIKECEPEVDAGGYSHFQMWDFIHTYGQHIQAGYPNVIEPLDIIKED